MRKRWNRGGFTVKLKAHLQAGFLHGCSLGSIHGGPVAWRPLDSASTCHSPVPIPSTWMASHESASAAGAGV